MTTDTESRRSEDRRESTYYVPSRWVASVTQAVTAGITIAVTAAITAVVTILLLLGGLWLAHIYLPANVFYIILAVLTVDIALGIVLRPVPSRR